MTTQEKLQKIFEAALNDTTDFTDQSPQPANPTQPLTTRLPEDKTQLPSLQELVEMRIRSQTAG